MELHIIQDLLSNLVLNLLKKVVFGKFLVCTVEPAEFAKQNNQAPNLSHVLCFESVLRSRAGIRMDSCLGEASTATIAEGAGEARG